MAAGAVSATSVDAINGSQFKAARLRSPTPWVAGRQSSRMAPSAHPATRWVARRSTTSVQPSATWMDGPRRTRMTSPATRVRSTTSPMAARAWCSRTLRPATSQWARPLMERSSASPATPATAC
ncbi:hypothetical protein [Variovorax sp. OV329]|uniref:hypothetical protein n=1 Tax=Variovorax sp. OV329 TaxID=1882825 RepID=UPI0020C84782|nr:hypothetical protein [Variovorax sp. OV329]